MALKKCKSCGNMIAYSSRRCPQCGAYLWTTGRIGCAIFILLFAFAFFMSYKQYSNTSNVERDSTPEVTASAMKHPSTKGKYIEDFPTTVKPPEVPPPLTTTVKLPIGYTFNGYTLNDREQTVLKAMILNDFYGYMDGKKTLLSPQIFTINAIAVTSYKLQSDYESNEVAGDQKYRGKTLFITGVVSSINRGIGENYYLALEGGSNMFSRPHASMSDGFENYLANLKKGQTVHLVCQGNGMLIGSAIVNKCEPTNIFVENLVSTWVAHITDQFLKGDKNAQLIVVLSVAAASILPKSSDCFGTDSDKYNKCMTEIINIFKEKETAESIVKLAADKLKLDFAKFKGKPTEEDSSELVDKKKQLAIVNSPSIPAAGETNRDGRFISYNNGTVLDTRTNLMWAAKDNGSNINWANAKSYCGNYRGGGYTDWRMPTQDELAGLYDNAKTYKSNCSYDVHLDELIRLSCSDTWASETSGSDAAFFLFGTPGNGGNRWFSPPDSYIGFRALPVRSDK